MARTIESIVICVGGCCRSMVTEQEKWLSPAATHKFMGQFVMRMRFANVLCHIRVCVSFDGSDNQVNKQTNEVFGTDRFFDGQITIIIWHLTKSIGLGLIDFSLHNNDEPNYDRRNARRFTFYVLCFQLALQWILHEFVLTLLWLTITQLARTIETGGLQCVWFRIQPTTRDQFNWFFSVHSFSLFMLYESLRCLLPLHDGLKAFGYKCRNKTWSKRNRRQQQHNTQNCLAVKGFRSSKKVNLNY